MDIAKQPILIYGCPRSGTLLTSRVIGGSETCFLVTEHANKARYCPEDVSGINDSELWWRSFEYPLWDEDTGRPLVETPRRDPGLLDDLRQKYLSLAGEKRLVLKNPAHLARPGLLREMFPDALVVYCARQPWHTLQSMTIKGNKAFLIKSWAGYALPDDLLLRAAVSWGEANHLYACEHDENWIVSRYEDLVASPRKAVDKLFDFLGIEGEADRDRAAELPEERDKGYTPVQELFNGSAYKNEIMRVIKPGCDMFGYSADPRKLPSGEGRKPASQKNAKTGSKLLKKLMGGRD